MVKLQNFCWGEANDFDDLALWEFSTISAVLHEVIDSFLKKDMVDFLMIPPNPEEIPMEIKVILRFVHSLMIALVLLMVATYQQ
jgi:hypothetical protein